MEIDITSFFNEADTPDYSASIAETGNSDIGKVTWRNARRASEEYDLLDTDEKRDAMRAHIKGFGAWDAAEIAAMSDTDLTALLIQMIAGDMREAGMDGVDFDWEEYECDETFAHRIGRDHDGRIFYYLGD